jgi:hypothetical protein
MAEGLKLTNELRGKVREGVFWAGTPVPPWLLEMEATFPVPSCIR